jgi:type VI secretion system protein VasD
VTSDDRRNSARQAAGRMPLRAAWWLAGVALFVELAVLPGCKTTPGVTPVSGSVQGAADLNPSVNGRPSPLSLRVYELKAPTTFNQADFMALYQTDQATLGGDLVAREEIVLAPGENRPYKKSLAPETRFVGVVAGYRNLERATWRAIVAVRAGKSQKLTIRADSLAVSVSIEP